MLLKTAERLLIEGVLHVGNSTYRTAKLHQGIIGAVNAFLRATRCSVATTNITVANAASSVNITSTITAFEESDFIRATIDNYPVRLVPPSTVQRRAATGLVSGRPTMIGFTSETEALFDKTADQAYTMKLTRISIADFMPGSRGAFSASVTYDKDDCVTSGGSSYRSLVDSNVNNTPPSAANWEALNASAQTVVDNTTYVLPLPTAWANDVIHWGARAYALMGLDGHPDGPPAMAHFQNILSEAAAYFKRGGQATTDSMVAPIHNGPRDAT